MAKSFPELAAFRDSHRDSKTYEQFTAPMSDEARESAPDWFRAGVEAAMKAPRDEGAERDEPPADRVLLPSR